MIGIMNMMRKEQRRATAAAARRLVVGAFVVALAGAAPAAPVEAVDRAIVSFSLVTPVLSRRTFLASYDWTEEPDR